jgi:hypothetical protein
MRLVYFSADSGAGTSLVKQLSCMIYQHSGVANKAQQQQQQQPTNN